MDLLYKVQTRFLFHTHIKIKIPAFHQDIVFDELFAILEAIDKKYNSYQLGSYIDRINRCAGEFVEVDTNTVEILKQAVEISKLFNGTYDITIMPLIKLWGFYKENSQVCPDENEIKEAQKLIDYKKIIIDGQRVKIDEHQEIITGSFIKAFAVEKLGQKMREMGIEDAVVNAGGSTIMAINNESHPYWMVNVPHPESDKPLFTLNINDGSYSTSTQSKTFIDIKGRRYGHILNPITGSPSQVKQVGIITPNCMLGDMLSTAFYNETSSGFLSKIELLSQSIQIEGFFIDTNDQITYSRSFKKYILK